MSPINQTYSANVAPPLDGEGRPLSRTPDGKFISTSNKTTIDTQLLNQLTNNGKNTRALLEQDVETLLGQAGDSEELKALVQKLFPQNEQRQPGSTLSPVSTADGAGGGANIDSGITNDPDLNAAVTNTSRMVGQQLWNYKVTFLNPEQPVYELAPHTIKMLCIEDSILNWPLQGYIVIDARMEGFERSYEEDKFLHIRSDGRCEIYIEVWPTVRDGELPDDIWKIKFHGAIYDVEDLPHENMTTKAKKLYFWDKKFQLMQEQTREWSTATGKRFTSPEVPPPIAHATDDERSMRTGEAIASILSNAELEEYIDFDNWDYGAGKICYCAKTNWTIWENIQYILQQQISEEKKDICVLNWNRGNEKFELVPYHKLFEEAGKDPEEPGELQLEHLFFEGRSMVKRDDPEIFTTDPLKAPYLDAPDTRRDIKSGEYNTILNYQFVQTSGIDSSKAYVTKPIYSHWHRRKQFDCDVEENEIKNIKENIFTPNYVDQLLGDYPVFVLNKTKTEQYAVSPIHSPVTTIDPETDRLIRSVQGKGSTLLEGIYLNQCMVVRLKGSTHRLAGTFVAIDRLTEDSETDYDYQVCGQYFVAHVKHLMKHQSYVTDLTLVKIHSYDKLKNTNEDIY